MRLSARARYAVRLMLEVNRLGGTRRPVRLSEVSELTGISRSFLEQLAAELKRRSLLRAVSGRHGGYFLARAAKEISIREVITAVAGPVCLAVSAEEFGFCARIESRECRLMWALLQQRIEALFEEYSVADLSSKRAMASIRRQIKTPEGEADSGQVGPQGSGFTSSRPLTR